MIDIHYIQDANLISARFHAIEIEEVETLCLELKALVQSLGGVAASSKMWLPLLEELEDRLIAVLVHVWPVPKDPVVMTLLAEASYAIDHARQIDNRKSHGSSAKNGDEESGTGGILLYTGQSTNR